MSPRSGDIDSYDSYQHCTQQLVSGVNIDDTEGADADDVEKPRRGRGCDDVADGSTSMNCRWLLLSLVGLSFVVCGRTLHSVVPNEHAAGHAPSRTHGGDTSSVRPGDDIIWSDEFDGDSVDPSKWTLAEGDGCSSGLCGWGNNELEYYSSSNAVVSGGRLAISAERYRTAPVGDPSYTSAKMVTKRKAEFGLAGDEGKVRRFEASIKLPDGGNGVWPAFWMLPADDKYGGWPRSGEIDIMGRLGVLIGCIFCSSRAFRNSTILFPPG